MATISERERRARQAVLALVSSRSGITIREITTELAGVDSADVILRAMSDTNVVVSTPAGLQADPSDAVLDGALTHEQAAERIGSTPEDVSERLVAGTLIGLRQGGDWWFALWQFTSDGTLPALDELIAVWPGNDAVAVHLGDDPLRGSRRPHTRRGARPPRWPRAGCRARPRPGRFSVVTHAAG